jgi:hypothetical protein
MLAVLIEKHNIDTLVYVRHEHPGLGPYCYHIVFEQFGHEISSVVSAWKFRSLK